MDVELNNKINELQGLKNKLARKIASVQKKLDRIAKKPKTAKTEAELKKVNYLLDTLQNQFKELEEKLQRIEEARKTVRQYEREKDLAAGTPDERAKKDEYEKAAELYKDLINRTYDKYAGDGSISLNNKGARFTKGQKILAGVSAVAILIALYNAPSLFKKDNNSNGNTNPSSSNSDNNNPSGSNQLNPDKEQEKVVIPELEQEELAEIIKVEDESLIPERAQDLLGYLNIKDPDHGITLEEITAYLNYKNGFVKNTTQKPVETPTTGTFTNIDDEKQVYERANQIVPYFTTLVPAQNMTVEQVEEFLNYFYGKVDDPNYDGAAFTIDSINDLMFAELGSSVDILNEVKTSRGPAPIFVDYTKFFIDGSQGQKLAEQITEYRSAMIAGAGSDITSLRKGFTELFMNSWILKGNNGKAINAYTLESAGERALIDLMFLNTAVLCGDSSELVITHPITGDEVTLEWILNQANYEACPTTLDDGTEITLDKSSQDLYSMYQQAVIRKNQDAVLGLNQK